MACKHDSKLRTLLHLGEEMCVPEAFKCLREGDRSIRNHDAVGLQPVNAAFKVRPKWKINLSFTTKKKLDAFLCRCLM
jgi:hypothetical protein